MAGRRKRDLLSSRRRVEDEGEDDEDDEAADMADDSQSEASILTDDDERDAYNNDPRNAELSSTRSPESNAELETNQIASSKRRRRKSKPHINSDGNASAKASNGTLGFKNTTDTENMVNGFQVDTSDAAEEVLEYEEINTEQAPQPSNNAGSGHSSARQNDVKSRTADSQDYKAKRENDPAFVPNRGGFFMHDQRNEGHHHNSVPSSRGRGRGRALGVTGNPQLRPGPPTSLPIDAKWDHDLHEFISEPPPSIYHSSQNTSQQNHNTPPVKAPTTGSGGMSKSTAIGTVAIRIFLPAMKEPILLGKKMTVRQHTKLPDLRPPLRRDKPVRISIPDHEPRYIFPTVERSFIFIPRAQRPNQQRNRSRNRNFFQTGGSRRTSIFGGSSYTPSVAMSRRSSQAQDGILSPTGSLFSRPPPGAPTAPGRPVVKLPLAPQSQQARSPSSGAITSSRGTPFVSFPQGSSYPLPSQPPFREHRSSQMPMHQPRPQKQVSVATIESPEREAFQGPLQQEQQPFHHQVPLQFNQQGSVGEQGYYAQMGQMFPNESTPLSNIPEGAINAQPFQPSMAQGFYPYAMQQPMFYYAHQPVPHGEGQVSHQYGGGQVTSSMYMPQAPYFVPMLVPMQAGTEDASGNAHTGMYAHESNGMVYYYDPSHLPDSSGPSAYAESASAPVMVQSQERYYGGPPNDAVYYSQQ